MNSIKILFLFIIVFAFNGEVKAQGDYRTSGTSNSTSNEHNYSFENGAIYEINTQNRKTKINPDQAIIQFQNGKYSGLMTTREGFNKLKNNEKLHLSPGRVELTEPLTLKNLYNIEIIGNNTSLVAKIDMAVVSLYETHTVYVEDLLIVHEIGKACGSNCLNVTSSSDIHITNCRFDGSGKVGLSLHNTINATIENNRFFNCDVGLDGVLSKNLMVKNNSFSENRQLDILGDRTQFGNDFTSENSFRSYKDDTTVEIAVLNPGQVLKPGEKLVSKNGVYYLKMQEDGNLCLNTIAGDGFIWCMTTDPNKLTKGTVCAMQVDGNLNVSPKEKWVWSAFHKASQLTSGSYLELTNEGTIKIIAPDGTVKWQNI
jgi:parallel beta-helix repeat protein